jgi:hypothetical protein
VLYTHLQNEQHSAAVFRLDALADELEALLSQTD